MPRTRCPFSYRLHKARNCAVVTIDGRNHYLGRFGSDESHEQYARLIAEWRRTRPRRDAPRALRFDRSLSVEELMLAYWAHIERYYVKDGRPTSEQDNIRQALRPLRRLYGKSPSAGFGPLALQQVREAMIEAGRSRKLINKDICRIRAMFGWAVAQELLPVDVHQALVQVKRLRKGRSGARETEPVAPVSEEAIRAVLPHLSPQVAAMVELQFLSGARPQEVVLLRPSEVVRDGNVWLYHPGRQKTEHFDRSKVIVLGPRAQEVLRPWLDRDPESYCFVPAEAAEWQRLRSRRGPSTEAMNRKKAPRAGRPRAGSHYTRHSYRVAIQRACRRAGIPPWSPHRLRHTRATMIRQAYDLEAAKAVLGHSDTKITEIYAARDLARATEVMRSIG